MPKLSYTAWRYDMCCYPCYPLQAANPEVRTYVNGTIYSLLSRSFFKTQAHERGLPDMLASVSENSEPVFQNQISHILTHLNHPPEDDKEPEWRGEATGAEDLGIDSMEYVDEYDDIHHPPVPGINPHVGMPMRRLAGDDATRGPATTTSHKPPGTVAVVDPRHMQASWSGNGSCSRTWLRLSRSGSRARCCC